MKISIYTPLQPGKSEIDRLLFTRPIVRPSGTGTSTLWDVCPLIRPLLKSTEREEHIHAQFFSNLVGILTYYVALLTFRYDRISWTS